MKTYIVLISVDESNSRKVCEQIENNVYENLTALHKELAEKLEDDRNYLVFSMSDFMDEVNDQILDNLTEYFMSYVNLK